MCLLFSISSKQVEHSKWPFLIQKDFVDLSISLLQIKHLNMGVILILNIPVILIQSFNSKFYFSLNLAIFSKHFTKIQEKRSPLCGDLFGVKGDFVFCLEAE